MNNLTKLILKELKLEINIEFDINDLISGKIEVAEESLLSDEERQWLSGFEGLEKVEFEWDILRLYFGDSYLPISINTLKYKFKGLEKKVEYTRKDLGL